VLALRVSTPHTATAVREVQRPLKEAPPHVGLSRDERAAVARALSVRGRRKPPLPGFATTAKRSRWSGCMTNAAGVQGLEADIVGCFA
jgi:hypothetical protein